MLGGCEMSELQIRKATIRWREGTQNKDMGE